MSEVPQTQLPTPSVAEVTDEFPSLLVDLESLQERATANVAALTKEGEASKDELAELVSMRQAAVDSMNSTQSEIRKLESQLLSMRAQAESYQRDIVTLDTRVSAIKSQGQLLYENRMVSKYLGTLVDTVKTKIANYNPDGATSPETEAV